VLKAFTWHASPKEHCCFSHAQKCSKELMESRRASPIS
jgi:hypothetical protein